MIDKQKTDDEEEERRLGTDENVNLGNDTGFMKMGIQAAQTLMVNERFIEEIENDGFPRNYIIQSLNNDELNYATTYYYLLDTGKEF